MSNRVQILSNAVSYLSQNFLLAAKRKLAELRAALCKFYFLAHYKKDVSVRSNERNLFAALSTDIHSVHI